VPRATCVPRTHRRKIYSPLAFTALGWPFHGIRYVFFGIGGTFLVVAERVSMLGSYIADETDEPELAGWGASPGSAG
jgi:hypothetical protein